MHVEDRRKIQVVELKVACVGFRLVGVAVDHHPSREGSYERRSTYPDRRWVVGIVHWLATKTIQAPPSAHQTLLLFLKLTFHLAPPSVYGKLI